MFKKATIKLLAGAGIMVNGKNPWDMCVYNDRVLQQAFFYGNLGLGESFMRKWNDRNWGWDCNRLDDFIYRLIRADLDKRKYISKASTFIKFLLINAQKINPWKVAKQHYDLGNDLFRAMLDQETMSYSCGYWKDGDTLDLAQLRKLDLICKKLQLKAGETVLDIGCGWGGFAQYAASRYGVRVTGLTISEEQAKLARERCRNERVEILLEDYHNHKGKYDKIVSVGMFEHVGPKNYRTYMEMVNRCLKDDGIFLLHTISCLENDISTDPWIEKYIFPNGVIPSLNQILTAANGIFNKLDEHEFGSCYDKTLMAWWQKFDAAYKELSKNNHKYDERFYRMWQYYLLSCAGAFRAEKLKLWEFVFTKPGNQVKIEEIR